ncbi:hypothetical protein BDV98DRAFT_296790 [Pterulicium gracile]|uniref:Uncharacterized protein n=1 Tax=Pterulicium gracile TaxID=1884261 RepID=A0A5C3Q934_9AGAR|nr:hypothetical protein BDV98DRAFT_296790 [Pterula gracilis]
MKLVTVGAVLSAICAVHGLTTPGAIHAESKSTDAVTPAPFVTLIEAPTGLTRDDPGALNTALSSLAANITSTDPEGRKKLEFALYACSLPSFEGYCRWLVYDIPNTCNNVQPWFANTISSVDIFTEVEQRCFIYTDYSCGDNLMGPLREPYGQLPAEFDNRVRSFFCV